MDSNQTPAGGAPAGRVPRATYRLQLSPDFTFAQAGAALGYLRALGVSDLYASPLQRARAGSTHGYDVVDYGQISPALGGEAGFSELSDRLRERGLGLLLDIVPNHMGIGGDNPWWDDVLENGQSSPFASFFDIDWQPVKPELHGKVLLPMLGDQYGVALERGELRLGLADGAFALRYYESRLPLAPRTALLVLAPAAEALAAELAEGHADLDELLSILTALRNLPARGEQDPGRLAERRREKEVIKRRLAALCDSSDAVRAALDRAIEAINGTPGRPRSFDRLHELIDAQPYRLAFWRVAAEEINYRRFFDINDLAAVRVELPEAFAAMHALVLRLAAAGRVSGLRIDHPDGLWDPPAYFRQLQEAYAAARSAAEEPRTKNQEPAANQSALSTTIHETAEQHRQPTAGGGEAGAGRFSALGSRFSPTLYVVAEKILSEREPLPADWAVAGTTGYDFLNAANGLLVDGAAERAIDGIYRRFIAPDDPAGVPGFDELVHASKQLIMGSSLASELRSLAHQLERVNEKNRRYRDFTLPGLTGALTEIVAAMSIYRTYITAPDTVSERDRRYISDAVREARRRHPRTARSLFAFLEDTLLLRNLREFRPEDHADVVSFVMRFQQITGPIMAKSVEDTAFYIYNRLTSLNEVGGAPEQFGVSPEEFHRQNAARARDWPNAMLAGTTHDAKRGEDVRARISVLSEIPDEWQAALGRWSSLNERHAREVDGARAPDRNDEYLLYQTLLGAWPLPGLQDEPHRPRETETTAGMRERLAAYMQKATREAKVHTSWLSPNEAYDEAVRAFVERLLDDAPDNPFLPDALAMARRLAFFGRFNSLSQTLLRLTSPGVPDVYQGAELWDLSLVDPDNRRPVDFARAERLLEDVRGRVREQGLAQAGAELLEESGDGAVKLLVVHQALELRRRRERLFAAGEYRALHAEGPHRAHVVAFARTLGDEQAVAVAPRLTACLAGGAEHAPLGEIWGDTALPLPGPGRYRDVLSGAEHRVGASGALPLRELLATLPLALLERE